MSRLPNPALPLVPTLAALGWLLGLTLIVVDLVGPPLGTLGLWFAGGGGVLSIRGYVCKLDAREVNAFELGQDAERARSLRSLP